MSGSPFPLLIVAVVAVGVWFLRKERDIDKPKPPPRPPKPLDEAVRALAAGEGSVGERVATTRAIGDHYVTWFGADTSPPVAKAFIAALGDSSVEVRIEALKHAGDIQWGGGFDLNLNLLNALGRYAKAKVARVAEVDSELEARLLGELLPRVLTVDDLPSELEPTPIRAALAAGAVECLYLVEDDAESLAWCARLRPWAGPETLVELDEIEADLDTSQAEDSP